MSSPGDLFFKNAKNFMYILQMPKKIWKIFLAFVIMALEPVAGTYLHYEENSCDRQSTCYQTVLGSQIWLRDMFSNSIFSLINQKLGWKSGHSEFVSVWGPWKRWFPKGVLKYELSGVQLTTFIAVNNFHDISVMKLICFFKMCKILCRFWKCKK